MQGILESLLSAEWVKKQLAENAFDLGVWTLVVLSVGIAIGYKVGQWRTIIRQDDARMVLLDKYMVENTQLQQDLKIANHKLEKEYKTNTALAVELAKYEARYVERRMIEDEHEKSADAGA